MSDYTAFAASRQIAHGSLLEVALHLKQAYDQQALFQEQFHVFADQTGLILDLDLRGDSAEVVARYTHLSSAVKEIEEAPRGRGRPKLGVVSKEVTLLPRHWQWLAAQPGGASVALRKLIDEARKASGETEQLRQLQDRTYKAMSALAADLPGYETALRALFAADQAVFVKTIAAWPADYCNYFLRLAGLSALPSNANSESGGSHEAN